MAPGSLARSARSTGAAEWCRPARRSRRRPPPRAAARTQRPAARRPRPAWARSFLQALVDRVGHELAFVVHDLAVPGEDDGGVGLERVEVGLVAPLLDQAGRGAEVGRLNLPERVLRELERLTRRA